MELSNNQYTYTDFLIQKSVQENSLRNLHGAVGQNQNLPLHLNIKASEVRIDQDKNLSTLSIIASKKVQLVGLPNADRFLKQALHPKKIDWKIFSQETDFKQVVALAKENEYHDDIVVVSQGSKADVRSTTFQKQLEKLQKQKKIWTIDNKLKFVMAEKIQFSDVQEMHKKFLTQKIKNSFWSGRKKEAEEENATSSNEEEEEDDEKQGKLYIYKNGIAQNYKKGITSAIQSFNQINEEDYQNEERDKKDEKRQLYSPKNKNISMSNQQRPVSLKNSPLNSSRGFSKEDLYQTAVNPFDKNLFMSVQELETEQKWKDYHPGEKKEKLRVISEELEKQFIDAICKESKLELTDIFPIKESQKNQFEGLPLSLVQLNDFNSKKLSHDMKILEKKKQEEAVQISQELKKKESLKRDIKLENQINNKRQSVDDNLLKRKKSRKSIAVFNTTDSEAAGFFSERKARQEERKQRRKENLKSLKRVMKDTDENSLFFLRKTCLENTDRNLHSPYKNMQSSEFFTQTNSCNGSCERRHRIEPFLGSRDLLIDKTKQFRKDKSECEGASNKGTISNQITKSKSGNLLFKKQEPNIQETISTRNNSSGISSPTAAKSKLFGLGDISTQTKNYFPPLSLTSRDGRDEKITSFLQPSSGMNSKFGSFATPQKIQMFEPSSSQASMKPTNFLEEISIIGGGNNEIKIEKNLSIDNKQKAHPILKENKKIYLDLSKLQNQQQSSCSVIQPSSERQQFPQSDRQQHFSKQDLQLQLSDRSQIQLSDKEFTSQNVTNKLEETVVKQLQNEIKEGQKQNLQQNGNNPNIFPQQPKKKGNAQTSWLEEKIKNLKETQKLKENFYDFYGSCISSQQKSAAQSDNIIRKMKRGVKNVEKQLDKIEKEEGPKVSNFQEEFKNFKETKIFKRRLFNFIVNKAKPQEKKSIFEIYSMTHRKEIEEVFSKQLQK